MTQSAWQGPGLFYGVQPSADANAARGPSAFDQGHMLLDPRAGLAYAGGDSWRGWMGSNEVIAIDQIPATVNATVIAPVQTSTGSFTLATASAGAVNVGASVVNLNTGASVTGLIILDSGGTALTYPSGGPGSVWNPGNNLARNVTVTLGATMTSGMTVTIQGYDVYGTPMTETITCSGSGTLTVGQKAWKYISLATGSSSVNGAQIGVGSLCGLPIRADNVGYCNIRSDASAVTAITPAVTTPTATSGDARGTFIMGTITATSRMVVFQKISAANITSNVGMVGTQA